MSQRVSIPKSKVGETRYMRERIIISIINRHGGITQIMNINRIIMETGIPRKMLISELKSRLGCRIEDTTKDILIYKIETIDKLEDILETFITKYVLCPRCSNPEFTIESSKKCEYWICKACGDKSRNMSK